MAVWSTVLFSETLRRGRQDADYYQPHFLELQARMEGLLRGGKARPLRDVASVEYGYMPMQDYVESVDGEPLLRVTNLKGGLEVDDSDLVYVPLSLGIPDKKRLQSGDVLLVQCGDTTGKVGQVGAEHNGMLFPSFCLRIRSKGSFPSGGLALFLFSGIGQEQIHQRVTIATVRPNTSKPDVEGLVIPNFFDSPELSQLVEKAYARRRQAKSLLAAAEAMLNEALGLADLDLTPRLFYEARSADTSVAARMDAEYFQPAKRIVLAALSRMRGESIGEQFRSVRQLWQPDRVKPTDRVRNYDLTDALSPFLDDTLEPTTADQVGSTKKAFAPGDLVISRLRSYLKEIAVVLPGGDTPLVGSSEFIVLRPNPNALPVEALLVYLRSPYVQTILKWCQDGSNHPRFDEKELLAIPIPERVTAIGKELTAKVKNAIAARRESQRLLSEAKEMVEKAILGE